MLSASRRWRCVRLDILPSFSSPAAAARVIRASDAGSDYTPCLYIGYKNVSASCTSIGTHRQWQQDSEIYESDPNGPQNCSKCVYERSSGIRSLMAETQTLTHQERQKQKSRESILQAA